MNKISIRRLTPNPITIKASEKDSEITISFSAKAEKGKWKAKITFSIDTENPNIFVLNADKAEKFLIFDIEVSEQRKRFEKKVKIRVTKQPNRPVPFGIMVWRKNPNGFSYSSYTMV